MYLKIDVSKSFYSNKKTTEAISNIKLDVKKGEFISILGPSGCGKTTLLNIIAGLEKPSEGKVILKDKLVTTTGPDRVVVFQQAALFPWLNVLHNIEFGMKMKGIAKEERRKKAMYYLEKVNLTGFEKASIHELSGGMKHRVAIARAFCMDSEVLLMDEPFASLDRNTKKLLQLELVKLWKEAKKTIIFVTHDHEEAVYLSDRIVMLTNTPSQVKKIINVDLERGKERDEMDQEFLKLVSNIRSDL